MPKLVIFIEMFEGIVKDLELITKKHMPVPLKYVHHGA